VDVLKISTYISETALVSLFEWWI